MQTRQLQGNMLVLLADLIFIFITVFIIIIYLLFFCHCLYLFSGFTRQRLDDEK